MTGDGDTGADTDPSAVAGDDPPRETPFAGDDPPRDAPGARPAPPATDLDFLSETVRERDAVAFVHVGDRFDDDLRYLTRFAGPDRDYALVVVPGRAVLAAPALFGEQADREFVAGGVDDAVTREVATDGQGEPAGLRASRLLDDLADGGTVLVPQHLPHDAAVYLENAGYDLESTAAVDGARERKTDAEIQCLRAVQAAAVSGMARAESVLAAAEPGDDAAADDTGDAASRIHYDGAPLTTDRLRREVNAELARHGVRDAGNTVVGAGPTAADLHFTGHDDVRAGETVLLDISPRGPHGYYGDVTRTFVVDSDGGWERRAYVAVEAAREAALAEVVAGVPAGVVHEEAAAELGAYGFRVDADDIGFTHGVGHGVGVSLHEGPTLRGDDPLAAGNVVTVEPGVYDPERGGVRIEDLVLVTDDGYEILAEYPIRFTPDA